MEIDEEKETELANRLRNGDTSVEMNPMTMSLMFYGIVVKAPTSKNI